MSTLSLPSPPSNTHETALGRLSRYQLSSQLELTPPEAMVDHAVSSFFGDVTGVQTLTALTGGSYAYRFVRLGVLGLGAESVSGSVLPALLRGGSYLAGFAAESFTFAGVNRGFSYLEGQTPNHPFTQDWAQAAVTLAPLKVVPGLFQNQNLFLQHLATDGAMVAGNQLAYRFNIGEKPEGDLLTQLFRIEAVNWQMKGSLALVHGMAPILSSGERALDLSIRAREGGLPGLFKPLSPNSELVSVGGLQVGPRTMGKEKSPERNNIFMAGVDDPPSGKGPGPDQSIPSSSPEDSQSIPHLPATQDYLIQYSAVFGTRYGITLNFDFSQGPVLYLYGTHRISPRNIYGLLIRPANEGRPSGALHLGSIEKNPDSPGIILKDNLGRTIPQTKESVFSISDFGLFWPNTGENLNQMAAIPTVRPLTPVLAHRLAEEGENHSSLREILNQFQSAERDLQDSQSRYSEAVVRNWTFDYLQDTPFSGVASVAPPSDLMKVARVLKDYFDHPLDLVRRRAHQLNYAILSKLDPQDQQSYLPPLKQPALSNTIKGLSGVPRKDSYYMTQDGLEPVIFRRDNEGRYFILCLGMNDPVIYFMIERKGEWVIPPPASSPDFKRHFTPGDRIRLQGVDHHLILSTRPGNSPDSLIVTLGEASAEMNFNPPSSSPQAVSPMHSSDAVAAANKNKVPVKTVIVANPEKVPENPEEFKTVIADAQEGDIKALLDVAILTAKGRLDKKIWESLQTDFWLLPLPGKQAGSLNVDGPYLGVGGQKFELPTKEGAQVLLASAPLAVDRPEAVLIKRKGADYQITQVIGNVHAKSRLLKPGDSIRMGELTIYFGIVGRFELLDLE